jgi:hypothetical protein
MEISFIRSGETNWMQAMMLSSEKWISVQRQSDCRSKAGKAQERSVNMQYADYDNRLFAVIALCCLAISGCNPLQTLAKANSVGEKYIFPH